MILYVQLSIFFAAWFCRCLIACLFPNSMVGIDSIYFCYFVAYLSSYHEKAINALYELA